MRTRCELTFDVDIPVWASEESLESFDDDDDDVLSAVSVNSTTALQSTRTSRSRRSSSQPSRQADGVQLGSARHSRPRMMSSRAGPPKGHERLRLADEDDSDVETVCSFASMCSHSSSSSRAPSGGHSDRKSRAADSRHLDDARGAASSSEHAAVEPPAREPRFQRCRLCTRCTCWLVVLALGAHG
eukprot:7381396-Prymnesium_polylepis.1